jgi:hypothetical protein
LDGRADCEVQTEERVAADHRGSNERDLVMRRRMKVSITLIVVGPVLACFIGCEGHEIYIKSRRFDPVAAGRAAIAEYDSDGDGKLTGIELDRCPGLKAAINQIDPSGNQGITAETIAARVWVWLDSKLGAMALRCRLLHNGRPLPNAEVKFVPEAFLGSTPRTTTASTNKDGVAEFTKTPPKLGDVRASLSPGFYRIEITKHGEEIPAKYNTNTVLGQEIAMDAEWIAKYGNQSIEFNLEY